MALFHTVIQGNRQKEAFFLLDSSIALNVTSMLVKLKKKKEPNVEDGTFGGFPLVQTGAAGHHFGSIA